MEKLLEKYGDTQLSQLIITFSQPEMIKAINVANKLIQYLDNDNNKVNSHPKEKTSNEILNENPNSNGVED